jgi:hypothetical protein
MVILAVTQTGLTELVGTQKGQNGALSWGNRRDGAEGSCYYASW